MRATGIDTSAHGHGGGVDRRVDPAIRARLRRTTWKTGYRGRLPRLRSPGAVRWHRLRNSRTAIEMSLLCRGRRGEWTRMARPSPVRARPGAGRGFHAGFS